MEVLSFEGEFVSDLITTQSPTRVDFSGGTLDCWPLFNFVGGARTVNLSVDIYTGAQLRPRQDSKVFVRGHLDEVETEFENLQAFLSSTDKKWALLQGYAEYWSPELGFHIHYTSQSPVGAGLGGSSSLSISLIKGFSQLCGANLTEMQMVTLAHNVEAKLLHTPTGTQDYFPAILPGLHSISYSSLEASHEVLDVNLDELRSRLFLVYTGRPHHSGLNNWSVIKRAVEKDKETLAELGALKDISERVDFECRRQNWSALSELFQAEFRHRVALAPAFGSPEIEALNIQCLEAGASAVKICGAGGGGCVMIWSEPERRADLLEMCGAKGFQTFDVAPAPREN